jgi:hypothetical protein
MILRELVVGAGLRGRLVAMAVVLVTCAACGDDTVDPSNPDAGPTKDATADAAHKDGGAGDARTSGEAGKDAAPDARERDSGRPDVDTDADPVAAPDAPED